MHTSAELATFCKKKGFIYPSSEIYGGVAGLYDYGHLGTLVKKKFEQLWRTYFLALDDNFYELETAAMMHEQVFKASGHLDNFVDPVVKCSKCAFYERADHFIERTIHKRVEGLGAEEFTECIKKNKIVCPQCQSALQPASIFNLMFPLQVGMGGQQRVYLRPETAQGPYVNFKLQFELLRKKLPLGLALIDRAYRNEISPRNLTLRQREFTQAELQIFFNPDRLNDHPDFVSVRNYALRTVLVSDRSQGVKERRADELVSLGLPVFYVYHLARIQQFYLDILHLPPEKFRLYQLSDTEKAFYNKYHFDLEIELQEHGFTEVGGLHYRTDHDLKGHQTVSQQNQEVLDEPSGKKFIPHVLELSFGVDRHIYALLDLAYDDQKDRGNIVLHLPTAVTPFGTAVFPLVKNKPEIVAKAEEVYQLVKKEYSSFYDESGSVGRRYARADEIGVRYCITVDFESLQDQAVTIRDRETTQQERVKITQLLQRLQLLSYNSKGHL